MMIAVLPLFWGPPGDSFPPESDISGNVQPGGIDPDQSKTSSNGSHLPFARVLRDQSESASFFKHLPTAIASEDQKTLPDLEARLGNPIVRVDAESPPSLVTWGDTPGPRSNPYEGFLPVRLASFEGERRNGVGESEFPHEPSGSWLVNISQEGQRSPADFSPRTYPAGETGVGKVHTLSGINSPGLSFSMEPSPIPAPVVQNSMEKNGMQTIGNADRQQNFSDMVKGPVPLSGSSDEDPPIGMGVGSDNRAAKPVDRVPYSVQEADKLLPRIPSSPAGTSQGAYRSMANEAFQTPVPFEGTPATLAEPGPSHLHRMRYLNGIATSLNPALDQGKPSSMALPVDFLRDSGLSWTGDRAKDVLEATGKSVGVDQQGGQGINQGTGGSTFSQPGFQHSSSSLSPGPRMLMSEERAIDFPAPALQRLQLDVQFSESNRIQIDVGVQHRQVYAGLIMDHAALKNLAVQFVPHLEDQLAQSDMELQEFSAEVRDHQGGQEAGMDSQLSEWPYGQKEFQNSDASESLHGLVKRVEEQGLHLVA